MNKHYRTSSKVNDRVTVEVKLILYTRIGPDYALVFV